MTRRRLTATCAAAIALALSGCAEVEPTLELGTGDRGFEPIEDGQDLPMIEGAQGGWHLWISLRTRGLDPEDARVELAVSPLEAGRPRQTRILTADLEPHDGYHALIGVVMVMSLPECFQAREVLVEAALTDRAGRSETDERVVVPRWHEPIGECTR